MLPAALLLVAALAPSAPAVTTTDPAWSASDFATGFSNSSGLGPTGVAMAPSGRLYVADFKDGFIYVFGPGGGTASTATRLGSTPLSSPIDLAFTPDGRLYASQESSGNVVELDPATGKVLRAVATGLQAADGLAVDPLTGDLFVSEFTSPNGTIDRISNLASHSPTLTTGYATGLDDPDGIAFGPDGTLYVSAAGSSSTVWAVDGTNSATPGAKTSLGSTGSSTGPDGIMVGNGFVLVNRNDGSVTKIDLGAGNAQTNIVTGGSRGDIAKVGTDGCGYATQTDRVIKITNSDGTCSLVPPVRFSLPRTITLHVQKGSVTSGAPDTLSGKISSGATRCLSKQGVTIQSRERPTGSFKTVRTVKTNTAGSYSVVVHPTATETWRALVKGSADCLAATSRAVQVKVK